MTQVSALHQALALAGAPQLAAAMRGQPLPDDAFWMMEIAAGEEDATRRAAEASGVNGARLKEAAALYVENVVFAPNADHYRILAAPRHAQQATLRAHVGLLMKWLHPDRPGSGWEAVFAGRVLAAWNDLKTPHKRAAYDRSLPAETGAALTPSGRRRLVVRSPRGTPLIPRGGAGGDGAWRPAVFVLAVLAAMLLVLLPGRVVAPNDDTGPPAVTASDGF